METLIQSLKKKIKLLFFTLPFYDIYNNTHENLQFNHPQWKSVLDLQFYLYLAPEFFTSWELYLFLKHRKSWWNFIAAKWTIIFLNRYLESFIIFKLMFKCPWWSWIGNAFWPYVFVRKNVTTTPLTSSLGGDEITGTLPPTPHPTPTPHTHT